MCMGKIKGTEVRYGVISFIEKEIKIPEAITTKVVLNDKRVMEIKTSLPSLWFSASPLSGSNTALTIAGWSPETILQMQKTGERTPNSGMMMVMKKDVASLGQIALELTINLHGRCLQEAIENHQLHVRIASKF